MPIVGSVTWDLVATETPYPPVEADDPGLGALVAAYDDGAVDEARPFFDAWADESVPVSDAELEQLDPAMRAAYEVIEAVYATNLGLRADNHEPIGSSLDTVHPFFILPGSLRIECFDRPAGDLTKYDVSLDHVTGLLFIQDYRPRIPSGGVRVLYQTADAAAALAQFACRRDLVGAASATGDGTRQTWRRATDFLEPLVTFDGLGPMDNCHLESTPYVGSVWLSEDLSAAIVRYVFTFHSYFGTAWLTREPDGAWRVLDAGITGVS